MENATMTQPGAQPGAELEAQPRGTLAIRTLAMPADANPGGDIFGGWVLSQMDIAGGIVARERARGRVATVAVTAMTFHLPVYVGDVLNRSAILQEVYSKTGRSGTMAFEVWEILFRNQEGTLVAKARDSMVLRAAGTPAGKESDRSNE